jgi:hypothetical protein
MIDRATYQLWNPNHSIVTWFIPTCVSNLLEKPRWISKKSLKVGTPTLKCRSVFLSTSLAFLQ